MDDILYRDYRELNDTEAVINETRRIIEEELLPYICHPFDCNGNGRCVNGTCVCDASKYNDFSVICHNTIRYAQYAAGIRTHLTV